MIETVPKQSPSDARKARTRRIALVGAGICVAVFVLGWILLAVFWPFTREKVQADLGQATGSTVVIKSLRKTFFPPGCVMKGVTLRPLQNAQSGASVEIQQLTIRSSYSRLLAKHVDMIVDRAEANLPAPGQDTGFRFNSQTKAIVDQLGVKNSALLFHAQGNAGASQGFDIHELVLRHPGTREEMPFDVKLHIPEPSGELHVSGKLGRWRSDNSAQTPLSGTYSLQRADLGVFKGIRGILSSDGHFDGNIQHIQVLGSADTPDFEVTRSGHKVRVTGNFRALVDGTNGTVDLQEIHAAFRNTRVESNGAVAKAQDGPRSADLKLGSRDGRIQDVLLLFITSPVSPITGDVSFNATAKVPGTMQGFVRKVQFTSDFTIDNGHLTNPNTQSKMDHLSQQAQGEKQTDDPADAISNLTGHVELRDGVANFTDLKFRVPGALAHLHGTFDVVTQKVDMSGLLLMQADLPHATSGIKSFLLKPINVFLRKNRHGGARIPVTITGTYDKPVYKTDPM